MSQWSADLDRIEERLLKINQELNRLSRRFTQHEQAVIELAEQQRIVQAAMNGHREVPSPSKEKESSAR